MRLGLTNLKDALDSVIRFLFSSKRTILYIVITAIITIILSFAISVWLTKTLQIHLPSLGTIRTLGVEAYWDRNLENKTEIIEWGTITTGSSKNMTLYLRSISDIEAILYLNATNWNPANISNYISLSWNYNGAIIQPDEIIQVKLILSASSSDDFVHYLTTNEVEEFNLDIVIGTSAITN